MSQPPHLYLIRHADALDGNIDAKRPLSPKGHEQVREIARWLHAAKALQPDEIWHSSLRRARETAELLAKEAKLSAKISEHAGLEPESDPRNIAARLNAARGRIAVIGHEPHLSTLASLLVTNEMIPVVFQMKKASVLALDRGLSRWMVRWHISPEVLPR
jgi:phosphohistidine phosphatase